MVNDEVKEAIHEKNADNKIIAAKAEERKE